jgi:type I restriction modification DNA specificity protein
MTVDELVGDAPDGWEYTTLGAVCERGGGDIQTGPFGSQLHASDYAFVGIPSIMPQNIGDNRIVEDGIARITPDDAKHLSRYLVREGDIVYSRRGDVERRALVREREDGWLCGTGCLRVRLGQNGVDPQYATFYLGHPSVREWIVRHAHGATMPNLNTSILAACPFLVPPPAEQRQIGRLLGALDDKIELNRRMYMTLEAMARALFKSWFVDFDPAHTLADITDLNSESWSAKNYPPEIRYVDLSNTKWGVIQMTETYSRSNAPSRAQRVLRAGDTIVGTVRPGNGSFAMIGEDGLTGSTGFAVLRHRRHRVIRSLSIVSRPLRRTSNAFHTLLMAPHTLRSAQKSSPQRSCRFCKKTPCSTFPPLPNRYSTEWSWLVSSRKLLEKPVKRYSRSSSPASYACARRRNSSRSTRREA